MDFHGVVLQKCQPTSILRKWAKKVQNQGKKAQNPKINMPPWLVEDDLASQTNFFLILAQGR